LSGSSASRIDTFSFPPGKPITQRYRIERFLGGGWEGEVYRAIETRTGIPRAAKFFYPQRNERDRAVRFYATKLNRLRECPIVIQYHTSETIRFRGQPITCLISELVEGELLADFVARQPGQRLAPFVALHLIYPLVVGLEQIHHAGEYHGDIHDGNVMVRQRGIRFVLKLVDFYNWKTPATAQRREDVFQVVRVLYDILGGRRWYSRQPAEIKRICCGLRRDLLRRRFPTVRHLREHLDSFSWDGS
jgi:hypothetical protein